MAIKINKRIAKPISWSGSRDLKEIKYIVFHFTGNKNDTAKNNADYFASGNTRSAGAHFFVDKDGNIWQSIKLDKCANAVGGDQRSGDGGGKMYGKITNRNSVSIEMCAYTSGMPTDKQMQACRELYLWLQKKCPNIRNEIYRHWDVNGKDCPKPMIGRNNKKWQHFRRFVLKGYQYKAIVTKNAAIRSSAKLTAKNKIGTAPAGKVYRIARTSGAWAMLLYPDTDGRKRWIAKSKIKEIKDV